MCAGIVCTSCFSPVVKRTRTGHEVWFPEKMRFKGIVTVGGTNALHFRTLVIVSEGLSSFSSHPVFKVSSVFVHNVCRMSLYLRIKKPLLKKNHPCRPLVDGCCMSHIV